MGVKKYTKEVIKEGKRVRWPKADRFFPVLIAVILICAFTALILSIEDWAAGTVIGQLKQWFAGLRKNGGSDTSAAIDVIRSLF